MEHGPGRAAGRVDCLVAGDVLTHPQYAVLRSLIRTEEKTGVRVISPERMKELVGQARKMTC